MAVPEDFSGGGLGKSGQHAEKGGFSGPICAGEDEGPALVEGHVHVSEDLLRVSHARNVF